jgi:hypothetical protein
MPVPPRRLSLAPKSVTTPIAMGVAERIGGMPSLTAVLVIITGIIGAIIAGNVFSIMKLGDAAIRGFSIGVASHGIGTARAFQVNEQSGRLCRTGHGTQRPAHRTAVAAAWPAGSLLADSNKLDKIRVSTNGRSRRAAKNQPMFPPPPAPSPQQTWLWNAPYLAVGVFALAMLIITALLQWREHDTARSALEGDMHWAERTIENRLFSHQDFLGELGREQEFMQLTYEAFQVKATRYVRDNPELLPSSGWIPTARSNGSRPTSRPQHSSANG